MYVCVCVFVFVYVCVCVCLCLSFPMYSYFTIFFLVLVGVECNFVCVSESVILSDCLFCCASFWMWFFFVYFLYMYMLLLKWGGKIRVFLLCLCLHFCVPIYVYNGISFVCFLVMFVCLSVFGYVCLFHSLFIFYLSCFVYIYIHVFVYTLTYVCFFLCVVSFWVWLCVRESICVCKRKGVVAWLGVWMGVVCVQGYVCVSGCVFFLCLFGSIFADFLVLSMYFYVYLCLCAI